MVQHNRTREYDFEGKEKKKRIKSCSNFNLSNLSMLNFHEIEQSLFSNYTMGPSEAESLLVTNFMRSKNNYFNISNMLSHDFDSEVLLEIK
ncbi:hypothetical protein BpHYR1_011865 [Brachionus plicatilis]|uniref:Uncharacterized protein n=1 Tax=Brachionus plicatilis TaxID=10195 RepID=A0A3M7SY44_BRAPC|nr:hypothetical protein BpHYR1_011865 [Brachionus plicatilis]